MGFPDFTVLQMGILEGSREINYLHPQWRIFETSKEEDQDNINVSVFAFRGVFRICSEDIWGNVKIVTILLSFEETSLYMNAIFEGFNVAVGWKITQFW